MELVRSQGHRHDHGLGAQGPDEEPEGLACRGVGPVDVLDDDEHRRRLGQSAEEAGERVQKACLEELALDMGGRRRRVERGHETGEVGAGRPDEGLELVRLRAPRDLREDLDDGAVREPLVADAGARAAKDAHAARRRRDGELPDEPRLADAGLARDQQVRHWARDRRVQHPEGGVELVATSDRDGADEASGHGGDHTDGGVPMIEAAATAAASVREATPSLPRMFETWTPAVFSLMNSSSAIWRLVRPSATRPSTSRSRRDSPKGSGVPAAAGATASSMRPRRASDSSSPPATVVRGEPMPSRGPTAEQRSPRGECHRARDALPPSRQPHQAARYGFWRFSQAFASARQACGRAGAVRRPSSASASRPRPASGPAARRLRALADGEQPGARGAESAPAAVATSARSPSGAIRRALLMSAAAVAPRRRAGSGPVPLGLGEVREAATDGLRSVARTAVPKGAARRAACAATGGPAPRSERAARMSSR